MSKWGIIYEQDETTAKTSAKMHSSWVLRPRSRRVGLFPLKEQHSTTALPQVGGTSFVRALLGAHGSRVMDNRMRLSLSQCMHIGLQCCMMVDHPVTVVCCVSSR